MLKDGRNFHVPRENTHELIVSVINQRSYFKRKEMQKILEEDLLMYYNQKMVQRYMKEGILPKFSCQWSYDKSHIFAWVTVGLLKDYIGTNQAKRIMTDYNLAENAEVFVQYFSDFYKTNEFSEKHDYRFKFAISEALKLFADPNLTVEHNPHAGELSSLKVSGLDQNIKLLQKRVKVFMKALDSFYDELSNIGG